MPIAGLMTGACDAARRRQACIGLRLVPSVAKNQVPRNQALLMTIESPCILVCSVDMKTGYCFGCGRTRDEIAGWLEMTPETRREIMELLPARLETVERRPRRETRRTRMARERGLAE